MSALQRLAAANARANASGSAPMGLHIDKPTSFELASPMPPPKYAGSVGSATPFPGTPGGSKNIPKKQGTAVSNAFKKPQEIFA